MAKSVIETILGIAKKNHREYSQLIKFGTEFIEYTDGYFIFKIPYIADRSLGVYKKDKEYYLRHDGRILEEFAYPGTDKIWSDDRTSKELVLPRDFFTILDAVKCNSKYSHKIFLSLNDATIGTIIPEKTEGTDATIFVSMGVIQEVFSILKSFHLYGNIVAETKGDNIYLQTETGINIAFFSARNQ